MNNFFQGYVMMAVQASLVILGMLCARVLLKRLPKRTTCLLWLVVIFRLLCPVALEGPIPAFWQQESADVQQAQVHVGELGAEIESTQNVPTNDSALLERVEKSPVNLTKQNLLPQLEQGDKVTAANNKLESLSDGSLSFVSVLCFLWLGGVLICLFLHAKRYLTMKRRLAQAIPYTTWKHIPVKKSDIPFVPFSFGLFKPCIFVPFDFSIEQNPGEREQIILEHERIHIKRGDLVVKLLYSLAVCIHWWNPLVWMGASLLQKDIEMACDEGVLRRLHEIDKADYANILLRFSAKRSGILLPVAFGESNTQERIRNILQKKKLPIGLSAVGIVAAVCIAVLLGTRPHEVTEEVDLDLVQNNAEQNNVGQENDGQQTDGVPGTKLDTGDDVKIDTKEDQQADLLPEQVLNTFQTDLNRDGEKDLVVLSVECDSETEIAEEMIQIGAPVYVRVYDGKALDEAYNPDAFGMTGGYNPDDGVIWERMLSKAHVGNGFVYLCKRMGRDYLLSGTASCWQGVWEYSYEVDEFMPETKDVVVVEQDSLTVGATVPEDSFPVGDMYYYTKKLDTWINGATLLVDLDVDREPRVNTDGTLEGSAVDIWLGLEMQVDGMVEAFQRTGEKTYVFPEKKPVTDMKQLKEALQNMNSRYATCGYYIIQNDTLK